MSTFVSLCSSSLNSTLCTYAPITTISMFISLTETAGELGAKPRGRREAQTSWIDERFAAHMFWSNSAKSNGQADIWSEAPPGIDRSPKPPPPPPLHINLRQNWRWRPKVITTDGLWHTSLTTFAASSQLTLTARHHSQGLSSLLYRGRRTSVGHGLDSATEWIGLGEMTVTPYFNR